MVARPRAGLRATATTCGAPAPATPAAVRRVPARSAAVAVDVEPFASRVIKLAALTMVVRRVPGTRACLLRVGAEETLVLRMSARVEHHGAPGGVHVACGGTCVAEPHRRNGCD